MKTPYSKFKLVSDPTLEERLAFFEKGFREIAQHEIMCESRRPQFVKPNWWSSETITYPYACDCWLSYPLGSIGLRLDP